jgi:phosphonate degradation associated HDIG domain protein
MMTIDDILAVLEAKGGGWYGGEAVTQLEHALQCATLAEAEGAPPALIAASLLHDVGHLVHALGENVADRGVDDRHEERGVAALGTLFGAAVTEPVRLHVAAKRWLCAMEPGYFDTLSATSVHSLALQGGRLTPAEAAVFINRPHATDAVRLRRWDDGAKVPGAATPPLGHFRVYLEACKAVQA